MGEAFMAWVQGAFFLTLLPGFFPQKKDQSTTVRVGVGLSAAGESKTSGTSGPAMNIALFDVNGGRVGFMERGGTGGKWEDGAEPDVVIPPRYSNPQKPEYLSISASANDAVCVAFLAVTTAAGDFFTWAGDLATYCDDSRHWYHSNQLMDNTNVRPKCIWFSTDDRFPDGMGVHMPAFLGMSDKSAQSIGQQYQDHKDSLCKSKPRMHFYDKLNELQCLPVFTPRPPDQNSDGTDVDPKAAVTDGKVMCSPGPGEKVDEHTRITLQEWSSGRFSQPTYGTPNAHKRKRGELLERDGGATMARRRGTLSDRFAEELVLSHYDGHSAVELCESASSVGPDFVSLKEGRYCHMDHKTHWPICSDEVTTACFDTEHKVMRPAAGAQKRDELGRPIPDKLYKRHTVWGSD